MKVAPTPRDPVLPDPSPRALAEGDADVTTHLLVELRRANRTLQRLREVALAARDGDPERLRVALARLRPIDLEARRPGGGRARRRR